MNINLKKLFNLDEVIPQIHQETLSQELSAFGTLQYCMFTDGGFHFNLLDAKDDLDLELIKKIIFNHNYLEGVKQEKIRQLKDEATKVILEKYPTFKQINAALGLYDEVKTKEIKDFIKGIKDQVDSLESTINAKIKENTLNAVDITIKL
jgi:hypothetical protein